MILNRLGDKTRITKEIQKHFPPHEIYIETFFGAGGSFFNKPKAKHNIVNDIDSDVFNLFRVVINQKEELEKSFYTMPIHVDLLKYWVKNMEKEPVKKALRFLFMSNFTFMGKQDTINFTAANPKKTFKHDLNRTFDLIENVRFDNCDFRKFLKNISFPKKDFGRPGKQKQKAFAYNDPPYLDTTNTYSDCGVWTENDVVDLIDCNEKAGWKWAMSEFDHPFILDQAKQRGLNVITIGERVNLMNRRTEILLTNYQTPQLSLFN